MRVLYLIKILGTILKYLGLVMLVPLIMVAIDKSPNDIMPFFSAFLVTEIVAFIFNMLTRKIKNFKDITKSEALFCVSIGWTLFALIGAIPFMFYNLSFIDSLFESVSGITTTGSTIFKDFSLYPRSIFFWRSFSQWLGGLGIVVLFVAILPQFAVAGRQLFFAETPGPTEDKLTPRITNTAKYLWVVYIVLTFIEIFFLRVAGMSLYDSVCNSFSTISGGGFSPNQTSITGYNSSVVTWIITIFMFLSGVNFALQYQFFIRGNFKSILKNEEFKTYLFITLFFSVALALSLIHVDKMPILKSIKHSVFQITSVITTTGFASVDFDTWSVASKMILFIPMLTGASAGSASGGVKVVRILFVIKYIRREFLKILHPKIICPVNIDKNIVPNDITRQMISFVQLYFLIYFVSVVFVTIIENDFSIGLIGSIASLGNIGPGYNTLGPMGSFADLTVFTKLIFIFNMLIGRLEIIPIFVFFFPSFWKLKIK